MLFAAMLHHADVVDVEDIDPRQAEPLQAVLERPHDRVVGVVESGSERHWRLGYFAHGRLDLRAQQPPNLGRQHPFVARHRAQRVADATLGLSEAVIGRGIDVAHPGRPRRARNRFGLLPRPGETVLGGDYAMLPGGKGANQALAARRAGAAVVLAGAVGADAFADIALDLLRREGVDTRLVRVVEQPTGCAAIMVSKDGE